MPNPRKPPTLVAISGTAQKARQEAYAADGDPAEFEALETVPEPPGWLKSNPYALEEYQKIGPALLANKLLTVGSISMLCQYCATYGQIAQMFAAGMLPQASLLAQNLAQSSSLGLTPMAASRMRLPAKSAEKKPNAFANNGQRATGGGK